MNENAKKKKASPCVMTPVSGEWNGARQSCESGTTGKHVQHTAVCSRHNTRKHVQHTSHHAAVYWRHIASLYNVLKAHHADFSVLKAFHTRVCNRHFTPVWWRHFTLQCAIGSVKLVLRKGLWKSLPTWTLTLQKQILFIKLYIKYILFNIYYILY